MDPEIDELPTDLMRGLDFNVRKTSKGGYADYGTSSWARKETALTEVEQAAIEAHGLFNLIDFLPKKPSEAELRVIKEMFEASVDGRPYDNDKWGAYYRPFGLEAPAGSTKSDNDSEPATQARESATVQPKADSVQESVQPAQTAPAPGPTSDKAQDILAMIRARQQNAS
jgi:hypothetical protein